NFLENKPNVAGIEPKWLFDIDTLTKSMNYQPVVAGSQPNNNADLQNTDDDVADATFDVKEHENAVHVFANGSDNFNTASPFVNAVSLNFGIDGKSSFVDPFKYLDDLDMPELEDIIYSDDEEDVGTEAKLSNLETNIPVSPIPTTRVHKDHPVN
nr:hypothetical protein [Tanacetum cinerariifolium]